MFVKRVQLVRFGHKVAWLWVQTPSFCQALAIFSGFKIQLNKLLPLDEESKEDEKENFQLIHYNNLLQQESGRHKRRPYGHVRVKNYQIICLSSPRGPVLSSLGTKLQKTTHCGHYFNTLSTTPPPPHSLPIKWCWSCQILIHFPNDIAAKMQLDSIWGSWLIA